MQGESIGWEYQVVQWKEGFSEHLRIVQRGFEEGLGFIFRPSIQGFEPHHGFTSINLMDSINVHTTIF